MLVEITGGQNAEIITTSSRKIAEVFEKRHDHVVRNIDELISGMGVPQNWGHLFIGSTYTHNQNKQVYREYLMMRDGFSLLAMGFTGEKALKWKLEYIKAFNEMEKELKRLYAERQKWEIERQKGIVIRHVLTDTIKMKVADTPNKRFMYPNYTKLIYKTLFGKNMKELQELYHVKSKESIREYLTIDELKQVESMEMLVSSLLNCGWGYDQIKEFINQHSTALIAG